MRRAIALSLDEHEEPAFGTGETTRKESFSKYKNQWVFDFQVALTKSMIVLMIRKKRRR